METSEGNPETEDRNKRHQDEARQRDQKSKERKAATMNKVSKDPSETQAENHKVQPTHKSVTQTATMPTIAPNLYEDSTPRSAATPNANRGDSTRQARHAE